MTKKTNPLKKLERALSKTQLALDEVIRAIRETSAPDDPPSHHRKRLRKVGKIIPGYVFEAYHERHQRGKQLDQRYRELWLQERELLAAYLDPDNADQHDTLLAKLEAIRQQMTEIEQEFDPPDIEG